MISAAPDEQGAERWPADGKGLTALVEDERLPFPDALFDRIVVCHALEEAESPHRLLRELWRVAAPEARILIIVAHRRGLWARAESTPFGPGRPYTPSQLHPPLEDALFLPTTRTAWRRIVNLGLTDAVRVTTAAAKVYTFWDYQAGAWPKNNGIRIDHVLLTPQAADRLEGGGSILGAGIGDLATRGVTAAQGTTELLPGTVIVGSQVANNFYDPRLRPGQEPPAPPDLYDQTLNIQLMKWLEDGTVVTKDVRARVVGVLEEARDEPDWSIYMPLNEVERHNA